MEKGDFLKPKTKHFYFMITGKVNVISPYYDKLYETKQYFGQVELLSSKEENFTEIIAINNSIIFFVEESYFQHNLKEYFHSQLWEIERHLNHVGFLINNLNLIVKNIFLDALEPKVCRPGHRIAKKGQIVS